MNHKRFEMKIVGLAVVFGASAFFHACAQEAQITVRVVDFHTGLPISNTVVDAGFDTNIKPGWGWGAGAPNVVIGTTDTNGVCVLNGRHDGGSVGIAVTNTSTYYGSGCSVIFTNVTLGITGRRWQPWNPTVELRLKKVGNPIPLFCKGVGGKERIPARNVPVGYDLLKGDWVKPFGNGRIADLIFTYTNAPDRTVATRYGDVCIYDCVLHATVSNDGDGFSSVVLLPQDEKNNFKLPPTAPGLLGSYFDIIHFIA